MGELIEKLNCCGGGPPKRMNEREEKEINLFVSFELSGFTSRGAALLMKFLLLCGLLFVGGYGLRQQP